MVICSAYVSKYDSDRKFIALMISNKKKWSYPPIKKVSTLFRGIMSKHVGDFSLNCLHYFRAKIKL